VDQPVIMPGSVVRTTVPIDGWIRGGIVASIDKGGCAKILSGTEYIDVPLADLVTGETLPQVLLRFHDRMHEVLALGPYVATSQHVQIPTDLWSLIHLVFVHVKHPIGVPFSKPMRVEIEDDDPTKSADSWKG
jgi:hypothetical protein